MVEHFQGPTDAVWAQARRGVAVTPSDSENLPGAPQVCPKALWVSAAGTVNVVPMDEQSDAGVALGDLQAGTVIPIRVRRVRSTGTTATVVALY
jgi:hypothetical protein